MAKKRYARSPLMYIQQPNIKKPEATMQDSYNSPKKKKEKATQKQDEPKRNPRRVSPIRRPVASVNQQVNPVNSSQPEVEEKESTVDQEEDKPSNARTKKFKDMNLKEKVEYFADSPKHLPKMKCIIKTDEKTYRGIVLEFKDDTVFFRVGNRATPRKIPFDSITEVRMLGL
ncbi:CotO family spore coat protein [Ornithinibacillus halophilus]|uniref:Spore coat protein CotO n=1 Tax=Ornithinibacillus halophilus TaxID=930117 RepID=A0A1M5IQM6_9BACI|nr:CotO family spore coat protein [Ornithinibacillus halophilus]SHG30612.1 Spore coat protein CotO [Ornithinibacillus halophilus]